MVGCPTVEDEAYQDFAVRILEQVGIPPCKLKRAHRDERLVAGRGRHLLVKLSFHQDNIAVMKTVR